MSLVDVRDTLLQIAHPERVLEYADDLMELRRKQGEMFKLNKADAWLKPLLEFYTEDLEGWVKFVKNVRDKLAPEKRTEPRSDEYIAVNEYYKKVNLRAIQRRTRALLDLAISVAINKGLLLDTKAEKERYAIRCSKSWEKAREAMLNGVRASSPTGRVSQSHREELLEEFWSGVEQMLNRGDIPKP